MVLTRQILLRPPGSMVDRRQPLLENPDYSSPGGVRKVRLAEVAGATAAECAVVCCCCPCGIANLLVLAVYKLPAGLFRKALRRKRRLRPMKKELLPPRKCGCDEKEVKMHSVAMVNALEMADNKEVIELEKEMWEKFYSAGFWRISSQRSEN